MNNFTFGEWILVKAYMIRKSIDKEGNTGLSKYNCFKRVWDSIPYVDGPKKGIFLKSVRLYDGERDIDGDSVPYFHPEKTHKGAWICIPGKDPERVKLEDISKF